MRFLTAGESHGKGLVGILEGMPANVPVSGDDIARELSRRQAGYGRGGRMKIETDRAELYAGVRGGKTLGSPIALIIENRDYENWQAVMDAQQADETQRTLTAVRPGHADLAGCIKYGQRDARNILERASARETAMRVAVGAVCKQLLRPLGITVASHVTEIAGVRSSYTAVRAEGLNEAADGSPVRCCDAEAQTRMMERIDACRQSGDTAGGEVTVIADGLPIGVGSHVQADRRLDYALAGHLMGIQAVKSVEVGMGAAVAGALGSAVQDEIFSDGKGGYARKTNRAGGIEGGMSNGEPIVLRIGVKPIPTLMRGLQTVDLATGKAVRSAPERSDCCAVPAAGVVAEAVVAYVLADTLLAVTGGDTLDEVAARVRQLRDKRVPQ